MILMLLAVLGVWMLACGWAGYHRKLMRFAAILLAGLALNMFWMFSALGAHPFEMHALMAQGSATIYALCAFGAGWFAGRVRRAWVDSRVP